MITNKQKENLKILRPQRLHQIRTNKHGEVGEVIGFKENSYCSIFVKLDSGEIIKCDWDDFDRGVFHIIDRSSHLGEVIDNTQGLRMEIVAYRKYEDMDVRFDSGCIRQHVSYDNFKIGNIKDLCSPTFSGVGYLGNGQYGYYSMVNGINPMKLWSNMISRCYNPKVDDAKRYEDCFVEEEWHNFQNFAKWCEENAYIIGNQQMELDKDLLIKRNRTYGPNRCCVLPKEINSLIIRGTRQRKERRTGINKTLPIGVTYTSDSPNRPYHVSVGRKRLGTYTINVSTLEEAFAIYKEKREEYMKYVADIYKDQIPQKIYDALYAYEVEITD